VGLFNEGNGLRINKLFTGKHIELECDLDLDLAKPTLSFASKRSALLASVRYRFYMDKDY
jgi:hypothetical protein